MNVELDKPTKAQEQWLELFSEVIECTRNALKELQVKEELTFEYAFIRIFSKMVLTTCEIRTLLMQGYPEGAFALCRQSYEALVVMSFLTKNKNDYKMIERFFDDAKMSELKILKELGVFSKEDEEEWAGISQKYFDFCNSNGRLADCWWVEKGCGFATLSRKTDYPKNGMYTYMCKVLHISAFNSLRYISRSKKILIGSAYEGIELPASCAMIFFYEAIKLFYSERQVEMPLSKAEACIEQIRKVTN